MRRVWALVLAGVSVAASAGVIGAYGYHRLDWGCPKQDRLRSVEEVKAAFAAEGLVLTRSDWSVPGGPPPQTGRTFGHGGPAAYFRLIVCRYRCAGPRLLGEGITWSLERLHKIAFANVGILVVARDARSGRRLRQRVREVVDEEFAPPPPDRCVGSG